MRSDRGVAITGMFVLLVVATGVVAAGNVRPEAEAGMDQDAIVNSTVYLDGGGSWDPDGEVVSYEWRIERPNGSVMRPDCRTCSLTHFVPMQSGQYNVTVTVTDDDGGMRSDTLYVVVSGSVSPSVPSTSPGSGGGGAGGPSFGSVGSGGGGSVLAEPSRIERTRGGTYVLKSRGGSVNRAFRMMVGGELVEIPAETMQTLSADDGQVTYSETRRFFNQADATRDDIRDQLQDSSHQGHCEGRVCTFQITETSGDPGQTEQEIQRAADDAARAMGCILGECPDSGGNGGGDSSSSSDTSSTDDPSSSNEGSTSNSDSSGDGLAYGRINPFGGGGGGGGGDDNENGSGGGIPINIDDINPGI